jgi:Leucine-rich repeat (LRR) protein
MKKNAFYFPLVVCSAVFTSLIPCISVSSAHSADCASDLSISAQGKPVLEDIPGVWVISSELPTGGFQEEVITIFTLGLAAIIPSSTGHMGIGWVYPADRDARVSWKLDWIFRRAPGRPVFRSEFYWYGCKQDYSVPGDEYFLTPAMTGKISWQGRDNQTSLQGYKAHELSVAVSPSQAGSVRFSDEGLIRCENDYKRYYYYEPECGGRAVLTAAPEAGWTFREWKYDGGSSTNNPLTLAIDDDKKVTAVFEREPDKSIVFNDPQLEEAIRNRIDKPSGDIYKSDLEQIDWLVLDGGGITDLSGIEYCVNLTQFTLRYNEVTDISVIASLQKLENQYIEYTQVKDISAVAGLTGLKRLYIDNNRITDITPVQNLTALEYLFMDNNSTNETTRLQNIGPLSKLTKMLKLSMGNNQINDISSLAGMRDLIYLDINTNRISDISACAGLTKVEILWAKNNQITDISFIVGWTKADSLDFSYNQVTDISVMAGLSTLRVVNLEANQISDISALAQNQGMGQGDALNVAGNLLDRNCDPSKGGTADCDAVNQLKSRGVSVTW